MTTDDGGGPIIAMDLPYDFSAPVVVDLSAYQIVTTNTTDKEATADMAEQPYQRFLREQEAPAQDMSDEQIYRQFVEQSGMADMLGLTSAAAADLTAPSPGEPAIEAAGEPAADMSDRAMWEAFVEMTGFEDSAPAGGAADLSEGGDDGDEGSDLSDEEAWRQYQAALGQS